MTRAQVPGSMITLEFERSFRLVAIAQGVGGGKLLNLSPYRWEKRTEAELAMRTGFRVSDPDIGAGSLGAAFVRAMIDQNRAEKVEGT